MVKMAQLRWPLKVMVKTPTLYVKAHDTSVHVRVLYVKYVHAPTQGATMLALLTVQPIIVSEHCSRNGPNEANMILIRYQGLEMHAIWNTHVLVVNQNTCTTHTITSLS